MTRAAIPAQISEIPRTRSRDIRDLGPRHGEIPDSTVTVRLSRLGRGSPQPACSRHWRNRQRRKPGRDPGDPAPAKRRTERLPGKTSGVQSRGEIRIDRQGHRTEQDKMPSGPKSERSGPVDSRGKSGPTTQTRATEEEAGGRRRGRAGLLRRA